MTVAVLVAGFVIVYTAAATFLNYHEEPRPSDAIVLFIGPDYPERKKEALQLMEEGYADRLLIPALNQTLIRIDGKVKQTGRPGPDGPGRNSYPDYYENTHVELLEAKAMMDHAGFTSAILVSSPYHMRRISMIAKAVFREEKYRLIFKGSRFVLNSGSFSHFRRYRIEQVFEEYLKIIGFLAYRVYEKAF